MAAEVRVEVPGRRAALRAELGAGGWAACAGTPGRGPGHRAGASAPAARECLQQGSSGGRGLLGACKALCNRLNPAVVYLEPLEVSFVLRLIKNVWVFQLMFPGFPFFF